MWVRCLTWGSYALSAQSTLEAYCVGTGTGDPTPMRLGHLVTPLYKAWTFSHLLSSVLFRRAVPSTLRSQRSGNSGGCQHVSGWGVLDSLAHPACALSVMNCLLSLTPGTCNREPGSGWTTVLVLDAPRLEPPRNACSKESHKGDVCLWNVHEKPGAFHVLACLI